MSKDIISSAGFLQLLDLSNNDLSGSIPQTAALAGKMQNLLLNNMRMSSSLPAQDSRRTDSPLYDTLSTLSLARNYFEGSTDVLANSSDLQTLLLASNYFASDVVSLNGADILGKGVYQDPATEKLKEVGRIIQKNATRGLGGVRQVTGPVAGAVSFFLNAVR